MSENPNMWLNGYSIYWHVQIVPNVKYPEPSISGQEFLTWVYYTSCAGNLGDWQYTDAESQRSLQERYTAETRKSVFFSLQWQKIATEVNNRGCNEPLEGLVGITNFSLDHVALCVLIKHLAFTLLSSLNQNTPIFQLDCETRVEGWSITQIRNHYPGWDDLLTLLFAIYPYNHPLWRTMYATISETHDTRIEEYVIFEELLNFWKFRRDRKPSDEHINLFLLDPYVKGMIKDYFRWQSCPNSFNTKYHQEKPALSNHNTLAKKKDNKNPIVTISDEDYREGRFGKYLFDFTQRPLSTESFGAVWIDKTKTCMLKSNGHLFQDITKLVKEIRIFKQCRHDYIIEFHEAYMFTDNKRKTNTMVETWFVMENAGYTLYDAIWYDRDNKGFPEVRAKQFTQQLRAAIMYLKKRNLIHRAIKPTNILYQKNVVKLTDFGTDNRNSFANEFTATTIKYMAPEALCMFIVSQELTDYSSMLRDMFVHI